MLSCILALLLSQNLEGKVVSILDGDTLEILDEKHFTHRVRLAEIDAPEKSQAFGNQAKAVLSNKTFFKHVTIINKGTDRYGRTLGVVMFGERNINMEMVEEGYAWWYKQYSHDPRYGTAQNNARLSKKGLWVDPYAVAPWDFRHPPKSTSSKSSSSKAKSSGSSSPRRKK